ncbi:MAG: hypothetical protein QXD43_00475 [Candidatus Aenigmatarchaeota archaeon]
MKTKILIALLGIVAIAGCTIPGVPGITPGAPITGGGKGLEITSFTAEPNAVYSGSTVRVIMETENQGGATAYNSSSFAYLTGSNMDLDGTNDMYWRGKDSEDKNDCKYFMKDMKPADVVKGIQGDTKTFKWNLIAPNVTAGQTRTDTFIGRVYTDYETGVNGNIWVYTETEADAAKASGRTLNKASFTSTSGPVAVEVSVSPDPVIIYGTDNSLSITIKISNVASGTIYKPNRPTSCSNMALTTDDLNKVSVSIDAPDFSGLSGCTGEQELISGRPTTLVCDATITSNVTTFKSFPISVKVKYGYFTEKTASVTVQGR